MLWDPIMLLLLWKSMISKNKIKLLRSLKLKKFREQNQKTILEGVRLIDEAINSNAQIYSVFAIEETLNSNQELIKKIESHHISLDMIGQDDLNGISDTQHSQGIIAEVKTNSFTVADLSNGLTDHIIILDNISDPGNLGAIFRTCAWYGVKSIILASGTVDPFNFKSMRAAMGAHFYFDHIIIDYNQSIIDFLNKEKFNTYCANLKGEDISKVNVDQKWAIILGSEAHGISESFKDYDKITIKRSGKIESLNVSVACGIILDQLKK